MKAKQLRALREYVMELEHECLVLTGIVQGGGYSDSDERRRHLFDTSIALSRKILDRAPLDELTPRALGVQR